MPRYRRPAPGSASWRRACLGAGAASALLGQQFLQRLDLLAQALVLGFEFVHTLLQLLGRGGHGRAFAVGRFGFGLGGLGVFLGIAHALGGLLEDRKSVV